MEQLISIGKINITLSASSLKHLRLSGRIRSEAVGCGGLARVIVQNEILKLQD